MSKCPGKSQHSNAFTRDMRQSKLQRGVRLAQPDYVNPNALEVSGGAVPNPGNRYLPRVPLSVFEEIAKDLRVHDREPSLLLQISLMLSTTQSARTGTSVETTAPTCQGGRARGPHTVMHFATVRISYAKHEDFAASAKDMSYAFAPRLYLDFDGAAMRMVV